MAGGLRVEGRAVRAGEDDQGAAALHPPEFPARGQNEMRLTLGRWLAVGLEFELAADILRTAVTPWWNHIEQLAAIAAPRTGLNYFLEREIRQESIREGHPPQSVV
jgi:hypothetical protein